MDADEPSPPPAIVRLPRSGPSDGQSVAAWLYAKDKRSQQELERLRWQALRSNKKGP